MRGTPSGDEATQTADNHYCHKYSEGKQTNRQTNEARKGRQASERMGGYKQSETMLM